MTWRATRVGMTLASVVTCGCTRSWCSIRRSAWLSTSPLRAATTYGGCCDRRRRLEFVAVERVRVRFGDDADARPAGVTEHRCAGVLGDGERPPQQVVVGDRRSQERTRVVAQLADLRGGLVRERDDPVGDPDRARLVHRIVDRVPRSPPPLPGRTRSSAWPWTKTLMPAESRPRTSSRSIADRACWIDR